MAWLKDRVKSGATAAAADGKEPVSIPADLSPYEPGTLAKLAAELPAPSDALRYRDNFARLLPERLARLEAGIRTQDHEAKLATLLTLNVGCSMVGAPRLKRVVGVCLDDVQNGRRVSCPHTLVHEAELFLACLAGQAD